MTECPRWRLQIAHYLNAPAHPHGTKTEWEHKETSKTNGKAVRKLYTVPMLLNPNDPGDCNYPGEIIVAHDVEGAMHHPNDIIFTGDPTPDMEAVNPEAQAITDAMRPRWEHPIDTLPVNGGMNSHEQAFMETMMKAFAGQAQAQQQSNQMVPQEQYDELQSRLARLEAMLVEKNFKEIAPVRRA